MALTLEEHSSWLKGQLQRTQITMKSIEEQASQKLLNLTEVYQYYHGQENAYVNALNHIKFSKED